MIWLNAAAVSMSVIAVVGLIGLLAVRGFGHFWPSQIVQATIVSGENRTAVMGEAVEPRREFIQSHALEVTDLDI